MMKLLKRMNETLIFDIGFNDGNSSKKFLEKGFTVIGVECNPKVYRKYFNYYINFIHNGSLILVRKCIHHKNGEKIPFYVDKDFSPWGSVNVDIATRERNCRMYLVETITLKTLFENYGVPIYCKIDIEGSDIIALESLKELEEKPLFISCETECVGKGMHNTISGLEVINKLNELGYTKFFLYKNEEGNEFQFDFNTEYEWVDYKSICEKLIRLREKHDFSKGSWTFWYDVCATF